MNNGCDQSECGVCIRRDVAVFDSRVHIVTYVGEYAVQTMMAPEMESPTVALALILGQGTVLDDFPVYVTVVGFVGDENASIEDSKLLVAQDEYLRWFQRHNDDQGVISAHEAVVQSVRDGLLDLSTPISMADMQEESRELIKSFREKLRNAARSGESD